MREDATIPFRNPAYRDELSELLRKGAQRIIRQTVEAGFIETCFPRSERQRCLAHRMRNLAARVTEDLWPEFRGRVAAAPASRAVSSTSP